MDIRLTQKQQDVIEWLLKKIQNVTKNCESVNRVLLLTKAGELDKRDASEIITASNTILTHVVVSTDILEPEDGDVKAALKIFDWVNSHYAK